MSQNYIEHIDESRIEQIRSIPNGALSRYEFDRVCRFNNSRHAKGADIADRLTQLVQSGQPYRKPIFSISDAGKPSVLSGFIEGLLPTAEIASEEDGELIRTAFNGISRTFAALVEFSPLQDHQDEAEAMLQPKLHTIVSLRSPVLGVAGVKLVFGENELTDVEQDFMIQLPAVRLELVAKNQ